MLGLPTTKGDPRTFATAARIFTADCIIKVKNAMLPCLPTNRTFTAELMVISTQETGNYGIILGQDSLHSLDLDTSVQDNTIYWGEKEIPMVPCYYWTTEKIQHRKACLSKHPLSLIKTDNVPTEDPTEELNATEALQSVKYKRTNLEEVVEQCTNLDDNQQAKLLTVLRAHE
jgi:hypothetical protein